MILIFIGILLLWTGNLLRSGDIRGFQSMARMYTRLAAMPKKGWLTKALFSFINYESLMLYDCDWTTMVLWLHPEIFLFFFLFKSFLNSNFLFSLRKIGMQKLSSIWSTVPSTIMGLLLGYCVKIITFGPVQFIMWKWNVRLLFNSWQ